jgi:ribosome-associated translation inhibitor RaiA
MLVQIKTDNNIVANEAIAGKINAAIAATLDRFAERVTRVEVHVSDENGPDKSGAKDKRCVIEVRLAGHQPIAASHAGPTIDRAVDGAAAKIKRQVVSVLGKAADRP